MGLFSGFFSGILRKIHEKRWATRIPKVMLKVGLYGYNCDIFGPDNVDFSSITQLFISGNLCLGNHARTGATVYADGDVFYGDFATAYGVTAGGDIFFDDYADTCIIEADGNVFFGEGCDIGYIASNKCIIIDDDAHVNDFLSAQSSISIGNNVIAQNMSAGGNIYVGDTSNLGVIHSDKDIILGKNATIDPKSDANGKIIHGFITK